VKEEETAGSSILRIINRMGSWEGKAAEEIANDHPTLQQTFMRLCLSYIKTQSQKSEGSTDLRNEGTVKVAKKIASALAYEDWHLPMV